MTMNIGKVDRIRRRCLSLSASYGLCDAIIRHREIALPNQPDAAGTVYLFGPYRLIPAQQLLLNGDVRVPLGDRALAILIALVEQPGVLVTKRELMDRAWPKTVVAESNLKVQIAGLRKALGVGRQDTRYLATIKGRGYQFAEPVKRGVLAVETAPSEALVHVAHNIPYRAVRPIGRSATINALTDQLSTTRLITVAGTGGVGKTTVALAVARAVLEAGQHDVWFVDLAEVSDSSLVPDATAAAAGLNSPDTLTFANHFHVRNRPQLVVLDNCEHVIEAAAVMAERLVSMAPQVRVLATSREPLRATGEHVYRLEPLDSPEVSAELTAVEAAQHSAVELFIDRAGAVRNGFVLNDNDAGAVAEICRRLDGNPLAIELAARRVGAFSVRELLSLLDDRFRALGEGWRTAPGRHKTLYAMMDWSHELLTDVERVVLRRLGIFTGSFLLLSARAIAADDKCAASSVVDAVADLVAKSLVSVDVSGETVRYRLLNTTRDYARRKLADAGETDAVARRHAEHYREMYAAIDDRWNAPPDAASLERNMRAIDEVRMALGWAFSLRGDAALGVALTVAAIPAWFGLSALEECRVRVKYALSKIESGTATTDSDRMKLYEALAVSTMYTRGMVPEFDAAWRTALAIARALGNREYQLRALFAACCCSTYSGSLRDAEEQLQKFRLTALKVSNPADLLEGDLLAAYAFHRAGRQSEARQRIERLLEQQGESSQQSRLSRVYVNWRGGPRSILANVLWLQGFPSQALQMQQIARDDARSTGHPLSLAYTLEFASIPIAFYLGDQIMIESMLKELQDDLAKLGVGRFGATIRCVQGALLLQRNNPAGLWDMSSGLEVLRQDPLSMRYLLYLGIYARGLHAFGQSLEAGEALDEAVMSSAASGDLWYMPELLRIKGEITEADDRPGMREAAESLYLRAIELARQQDALSLELRAATSLARLRHTVDRESKAATLVLEVYEQFTEGLETADLRTARELLDQVHKRRPINKR
jgi:predicted ATPase/DNA-binding winged helix-turn-helix (wHTH) protein